MNPLFINNFSHPEQDIDTNEQPFKFEGVDAPSKGIISHSTILSLKYFLLFLERITEYPVEYISSYLFNSQALVWLDKNMIDGSTLGVLHSIGSDLTRTRERPEPYQNGSMLSGQGAQAKGQDHSRTPTSMHEVNILYHLY